MGAPTAGNMLADILPYLGVEPSYTEEELENLDRTVPSLVGLGTSEAAGILASQGLDFRIIGEGTTVTTQLPAVNSIVAAKSQIILYAGSEPSADLEEMPDLTGLPYSVARQRLGYYGLFISTSSNRVDDAETLVVSRQSVEAGEQVEHGTVIEVTLVDNDSSINGRY